MKSLTFLFMLQNRVDPFGSLIRTSARGRLMGNRGLIHDETQQIVRPFRLQTWITCVLDFKSRKRKVMTPNLYTELFFLDEATSFSAGHRPCSECRRMDFIRFKQLWIHANPDYNFTMKTYIRELDAVLHQERIGLNNTKITYSEQIGNLPTGCMIGHSGKAYLLWNRQLCLWTPFGYTTQLDLPDTEEVTVLTPRSIVNIFRAGYQPRITA